MMTALMIVACAAVAGFMIAMARTHAGQHQAHAGPAGRAFKPRLNSDPLLGGSRRDDDVGGEGG